MERTILRASPGMVLTDGRLYGKVIFLANGMDTSVFRQITQLEYEEIMSRQEQESLDAVL